MSLNSLRLAIAGITGDFEESFLERLAFQTEMIYYNAFVETEAVEFGGVEVGLGEHGLLVF